MADEIEDRLSALGAGPVPPLLPADAVRRRGEQRRRRQQAVTALAGVVAAVALGGAVALATGGSADDDDALGYATPSSSPSPTPSASALPTPISTPSYDGSYEPLTTPSPSTTPARPELPEQAEPEHGSSRSAVYLAVAYATDDPELQAARAQAAEAGYPAGVGDVSCDQGAREALGLDPERDYYAVALYFADRATAQQFVDAWEPGVVGLADVTTYCLD